LHSYLVHICNRTREDLSRHKVTTHRRTSIAVVVVGFIVPSQILGCGVCRTLSLGVSRHYIMGLEAPGFMPSTQSPQIDVLPVERIRQSRRRRQHTCACSAGWVVKGQWRVDESQEAQIYTFRSLTPHPFPSFSNLSHSTLQITFPTLPPQRQARTTRAASTPR
jgi:hypothetical protein